jgi:hypothetical protein
LFRRFLGLGTDDPVWVATVFTKNRDRLLNTNIARKSLGDPIGQGSDAAVIG